MIVVYDFDGTLTPYKLARFAFLLENGLTYDVIENKMREIADGEIDWYNDYTKAVKLLLNEKGLKVSNENLAYGADLVEYNKGVFSFLEYLKKHGVKQYIVTSGYESYVKNTKVAPFMDGIYGTTINDETQDALYHLKDTEKANVIAKIASDNNQSIKDVIFIGDGLTDRYGFKFVYENGGRSIFVGDDEAYKEVRDIVNEKFIPNYEKASDLYNYIDNLINKK